MAGVELYAPRQARHRRTWTAAAVVLGLVFIIGGQLLSVLPVVASPIDLLDGDNSWQETAYVLVASFGACALINFLWVWLFERRSLATIGFNGRGLERFGRGYGLGLLMIAAVVGMVWAAGGYSVEALGAYARANPLAALLPIVVLLFGFIVQGSTEEIVMRGWLMQLIASRHGLWLAVIGNSLLFSLLHGANISPSRELVLGLINIVLAGLFLSLYAAREGSLWGVCGWHAAWNWLLGLGFGLEVSGQVIETPPLVVDFATNDQIAWWITGGAFGPEASVVTSAVLGAGVAWLALKGRTHDHGAVANAKPVVL